MKQATPVGRESCTTPISDNLFRYINTLTQRSASKISFQTGSGRIFNDLLIHWPKLEDWEDETQDICQRITDTVYPLTSALLAQGVEIEITISPSPLEFSGKVEAMETLLLFDGEQQKEYHYFLSPKKPLPYASSLRIARGIGVVCRPLNYNYHKAPDDRGEKENAKIGIFELAQRLINEMYERPDFIQTERNIIGLLRIFMQHSPDSLKMMAPFKTAAQVSLPLAKQNNLANLPPQVAELERRILGHANDRTLSASFRTELRQLANDIRTGAPQAEFNAAANAETKVRPAVTPPRANVRQNNPRSRYNTLNKIAKTAPVSSVGRLDKTAQARADANRHLLKYGAAQPSPIISD